MSASKIGLLTATAAVAVLAAFPAIAQSGSVDPAAAAQPANPENPGVTAQNSGDIVVTARGRQESLKDVPVSVSAVSGETLQKLNVQSTNQLTAYVPSVHFSDTAPNYFGGRLQNRPIIIRGLNLANSFGVSAAALVFLDGAPVLGSELAPGLDYERIEVLRGPQSVQFGRSTMAGAINYVTKDIGNSWHGNFEASYGSYDSKSLIASVSGPLTDALKVGLSGSTISNDGYYKNGIAGSERLGARNTRSIAGRIQWEPTSRLKIKGYINYFENDDGPPATAQLSASADNCSLGGTRLYYCGAFPNYKSLGLYTNTNLPASATGFIFNSFTNPGGRFDSKLGSQRKAALGHVIGTWDVTDGIRLSSLTAYEWDASLSANNGKLKPDAPTDGYNHYFFSASFLSKSFSQEFRLSSMGQHRFRWTAGASYNYGESDQQFRVDSQLNPTAANPNPAEALFDTGVQFDKSKAYGIFGGAYYDLFEPLTISVEARYQWDKRTGVPQFLYPSAACAAYSSLSECRDANTLTHTFGSFSPRAAINYKITPELTAYVSASRGNRPGGFNLRLPAYINNAAVIADLVRQIGPVNLAYKEERLTNYEIGLKGSALDRRLNFAVDFYYGDLTNQQILNNAFIAAINNSLQVTSNVGKTQIYGVEAEGSLRLNHMITLTGDFSWNHNEIKKYLCTACVIYTGQTNSSIGRALSGSPEYSGSIALDATDDLGQTGWKWFGHVDYAYTGKISADNLVYISDETLNARNVVNLRAGVSRDHLTLEAFVTNLTNDRGYESSTTGQDYAANRFTAFSFNLPQPRIFGARAQYKF
ncbi:TonB-dependent receptor [Sphingomonas sp. CGMCC 1.13654]|uniref:TonB-dependent receptor n=1 Tax=Sphingomonas chungangi TaxID=2683589 RepID=A0A838LBH2_9SPHN|nr:TonB-dependent receptor [Sphingomonas chungangi]MBA2934838.1 TonB-dependent receptor [Sphingomonas chungangi]MVW58149.1 TonB-dependent receptor [Sphingomonas chungangi]